MSVSKGQRRRQSFAVVQDVDYQLIACTIAFFAPVLLVLPCILALFGGLIFTTLLSKLEVPGGILVPSLLLGLCLFTMVPYGMLCICATVGGVIGEILYQAAGKENRMNAPVIFILCVLTVVIAIFGCLWGQRIADKRLAKG